jgi:hypothetical protein
MIEENNMKMTKRKPHNVVDLKRFVIMTIMSLSCTIISPKLHSQIPATYVLEDTLQGLYIPDDENLSAYLKINEKAKESITLVFEMQFNDSIVIKLNDSIWVSKKIMTSPTLSMVEEVFELDFRRYKNVPIVTILLPDVKKYIMFIPVKGYGIVYLNRMNSSWILEYSNYGKLYR